jgi:hypothetical protein
MKQKSSRGVVSVRLQTDWKAAMRSAFHCFGLLGLGLVIAGNADAQVELAGVELPASVEVNDHELQLASCGVRDTLWVTHYVAALYVADPDAAAQIAVNPDEPKLIRLDIIDTDWLPEGIPEKWREPLREELARDPYSRVKQHYQALSAGDVVYVYYLPGQGIRMSVNGRLVMEQPGHELIDAMLEAWAEPDPISEQARRLLFEHPC